MRKKVVLFYALTLLSTQATVLAAEVAGGTWNCGVGLTGSYSDYYHSKKTHSSSVTKGSQIDSHKVGNGKWAKSRLTIFSGCNFYYNVY
ncbi:MAG: lactococcin 972 family bacteriocin [Streptococcaceae bacterium]|jgi:lactococcin 972 family bacteriocin|nr:lactococcin 972 family bacteriocin [Streptococcaceae bacterium]